MLYPKGTIESGALQAAEPSLVAQDVPKVAQDVPAVIAQDVPEDIAQAALSLLWGNVRPYFRNWNVRICDPSINEGTVWTVLTDGQLAIGNAQSVQPLLDLALAPKWECTTDEKLKDMETKRAERLDRLQNGYKHNLASLGELSKVATAELQGRPYVLTSYIFQDGDQAERKTVHMPFTQEWDGHYTYRMVPEREYANEWYHTVRQSLLDFHSPLHYRVEMCRALTAAGSPYAPEGFADRMRPLVMAFQDAFESLDTRPAVEQAKLRQDLYTRLNALYWTSGPNWYADSLVPVMLCTLGYLTREELRMVTRHPGNAVAKTKPTKDKDKKTPDPNMLRTFPKTQDAEMAYLDQFNAVYADRLDGKAFGTEDLPKLYAQAKLVTKYAKRFKDPDKAEKKAETDDQDDQEDQDDQDDQAETDDQAEDKTRDKAWKAEDVPTDKRKFGKVKTDFEAAFAEWQGVESAWNAPFITQRLKERRDALLLAIRSMAVNHAYSPTWLNLIGEAAILIGAQDQHTIIQPDNETHTMQLYVRQPPNGRELVNKRMSWESPLAQCPHTYQDRTLCAASIPLKVALLETDKNRYYTICVSGDQADRNRTLSNSRQFAQDVMAHKLLTLAQAVAASVAKIASDPHHVMMTSAGMTEQRNAFFTRINREYMEERSKDRDRWLEKYGKDAEYKIAPGLKSDDSGQSPLILAIRKDIQEDTKLRNITEYSENLAKVTMWSERSEKFLPYKLDSDLVKANGKLVAQAFGEGLDLVHTAATAIMEVSYRVQKELGALGPDFLDAPLVDYKHGRRTASSVTGIDALRQNYKPKTKAAVQLAYADTSLYIRSHATIDGKPKNSATWISLDTVESTDDQSGKAAMLDYIYFRIGATSDLYGDLIDGNVREDNCPDLYYAVTRVWDVRQAVEDITQGLKHKAEAVQIIKYKMKWQDAKGDCIGAKAIANRAGLKVQLVKDTCKALKRNATRRNYTWDAYDQAKAEAAGTYVPPLTSEDVRKAATDFRQNAIRAFRWKFRDLKYPIAKPDAPAAYDWYIRFKTRQAEDFTNSRQKAIATVAIYEEHQAQLTAVYLGIAPVGKDQARLDVISAYLPTIKDPWRKVALWYVLNTSDQGKEIQPDNETHTLAVYTHTPEIIYSKLVHRPDVRPVMTWFTRDPKTGRKVYEAADTLTYRTIRQDVTRHGKTRTIETTKAVIGGKETFSIWDPQNMEHFYNASFRRMKTAIQDAKALAQEPTAHTHQSVERVIQSARRHQAGRKISGKDREQLIQAVMDREKMRGDPITREEAEEYLNLKMI